ncbi:MAG: hypothetical protein K2X86_00260, partial [Cytophagaceae bacterium]|nr:hypothetical protein [Cytophagaceae bacterium]
ALCVLLTLAGYSQSSYVPLNNDYYHLLDRYEILNGKLSTSFFTGAKPVERKAVAEFMDSLKIDSAKLSRADRFNLEYLSNDNWEWSESSSSDSRKPVLKHFYKKKSDMFSVHTDEFDLHVNPVIYVQLGQEMEEGASKFLNSRGIEIRGMINNKIGFYTFVADNQASFSNYVNRYIVEHNAIPAEGFKKTFKTTGVDFLTARGYFTFNVTKNIHFQFGHDRNFIGNGYRSLILSDFSTNYTFLKINTRIWKFNYMNLFTEMNASPKAAKDTVLPKKYLAFHHLSLNVSKNFNIGIFESVVFGRGDTLKHGQFDFNYLNPIIFFRSIEQQTGSGDNALLGLDYKWNFLKHFSFYGQIVLDEFFLAHIKARDGWWANKQAAQFGLKCINVGGIKNLDMQVETNIIRPYTYAHSSKYTSYTHYNQSLAHPLGANLYEFIGIARYQPMKRLNLTGKLIFIKFGDDSSTTNIVPPDNNGGNILKSYSFVPTKSEFGNKIGQGIATNILYLSFTATYQLRHNFFIDLTQIVRRSDSALNSKDMNTMFTALGIRWNIPQRLQEF